ncbi:MAG: phosphate acyltransferase, partial [Clostridia bacterium]|nr:phosphate acyltransferase [Clostridia bacterium]
KDKVYEIKDMMDYNNYGGAVLLGCAKTVVKGHGSSKATSIFHCIEQAYNMEKNNLRDAIFKSLSDEKE